MLSPYHKAYAAQSDDEIAQLAEIKLLEFRKLFIELGAPVFTSPMVRMAVLGCGDRRLVAHYQRIFKVLFGSAITMVTLDKTVDHLEDASGGILRHDVTNPLPNGPYDFIYANILLRFIKPARQVDVIANAFDALAPGGWALFIFQQAEIDPPEGFMPPEGTYPINFNALQFELSKRKISFMEVPLNIEITPPGSDEPIKIDELALVLQAP